MRCSSNGPDERIRWGGWDTPAYNGTIAHGHDDLLISAARCTVLDQQDRPGIGSAETTHRADHLDEIDQTDWQQESGKDAASPPLGMLGAFSDSNLRCPLPPSMMAACAMA